MEDLDLETAESTPSYSRYVSKAEESRSRFNKNYLTDQSRANSGSSSWMDKDKMRSLARYSPARKKEKERSFLDDAEEVIQEGVGAARSAYHKIDPDYRTPLEYLRHGDFKSLAYYMKSAYDRKVAPLLGNAEEAHAGSFNTNTEVKRENNRYYTEATPSSFTRIGNLEGRYANVRANMDISHFKLYFPEDGNDMHNFRDIPHTMGIAFTVFGKMVPSKGPFPNHYVFNHIAYNPKNGRLTYFDRPEDVPDEYLVNAVPSQEKLLKWMKPFETTGFIKDDKGGLLAYSKHRTSGYKGYGVPTYRTVDGGEREANFFGGREHFDPTTLDRWNGGHAMYVARPKNGAMQIRVVHGSVQNHDEAMQQLMRNTGVDRLTVVPLDNGSYSASAFLPEAFDENGFSNWGTMSADAIQYFVTKNSTKAKPFFIVDVVNTPPARTYFEEGETIPENATAY